jgi:hypothetical protein
MLRKALRADDVFRVISNGYLSPEGSAPKPRPRFMGQGLIKKWAFVYFFIWRRNSGRQNRNNAPDRAKAYSAIPAWHGACDSSPRDPASGRSHASNRRTSR